VSYEECEQDNTTADNTQIEKLLEQAAAQGIAVVVGSGDAGSAGCDPFAVNGQDNPEAINGMKVSGLAQLLTKSLWEVRTLQASKLISMAT
jgi:hypothetical protein